MGKVFVLMYDDGDKPSSIAVFRKKPTDAKLVELNLGMNFTNIEDVRDAFENYMYWEERELI